MTRAARMTLAVMVVAGLGFFAGAWAERYNSPGTDIPTIATATPTPMPTPCRIYYVSANGSESCFKPQPYGIEPFP